MNIGAPTVLNLIPGGIIPIVYVNQYDKGYEKRFLLYKGAEPFNIADNMSVTIRGTKGDNHGIINSVSTTVESNLVSVTLTEQMTAVEGVRNVYELRIVDTNNLLVGTVNFILAVEPSALNDETIISDSDLSYAEDVYNRLQGVEAYYNKFENGKVERFATCVDMKASTALKSGMVCQTAGYYAVNDGGAALYYIMGAAPVDDYYETLQNGLIAILITKGSLSYRQFGAKGDGITNDYDAIKACHLAANAASVPIVNYGGTYYATGVSIPVATDVYNYGATFIIGNSNLGENPLFLMSHDTETSVSGVLLSTVFSDQDTVTSAYEDKAFVVTTNIALGTSAYTGQTGEVVEEPMLACGDRAELVMEKYATASGWTVDINHITDATEHGYTWHGGTIRQKDTTRKGVCFLKVARNNCTVEHLNIEVYNALAENTIIYGYTANNLTISDIKAMTDTEGSTWGNYAVSVMYSANLLVRNLKGEAHYGGSSTVTTRCIKNYTLRDSITTTFDVHWNAFGVFLVEGCTVASEVHIGYGDGIFTIKASTITGTLNPRTDFVPIFHGDIVFEDSIVGFIYISMPRNDDTTRDMTYFAAIKPPTYYLNRIKRTDPRFLFWSGINATMEALLDGNIWVYLSNMETGNLSNAYGNTCFRMVAKNPISYTGLETWFAYGFARTDSGFDFAHTQPQFVDGVTVEPNKTIRFFERGGVEHLTVSAVITANISAWTPIMRITAVVGRPATTVYFTGYFNGNAVPMYVTEAGAIVTTVAINGTQKRFVFNASW